MMTAEPVPNEAATVEAHLYLARYMARRAVARSGGRTTYDVALSAAMLGLLRAVRTYDPSQERGGGFGNYAAALMGYAITDDLRDCGDVSRAYWRHGRRPPVQLEDYHWADREAAPDHSVEVADEVDAILRRVPAGRLRDMFVMYHLGEMRLRDIGARYDLSQCRASQILVEARRALSGGGMVVDLRGYRRARGSEPVPEGRSDGDAASETGGRAADGGAVR